MSPTEPAAKVAQTPGRPPTPAKPLPPSRAIPTKKMPTDRIKFEKQVDLLRAYVSASGPTRRAVFNKEIAAIIEMQEPTTSLANGFFIETGLLVKTDTGFVPNEAVVEFKRAEEVGAEDPPGRLAPLFRRSWFFETLRPKLEMKPLEEKVAIADLAMACGAGQSYFPQLKTLIDFLAFARVVQRDGTALLLVRDGVAPPAPPTDDVRRLVQPPPLAPERNAENRGGGQPPTINGVGFNIAVSVPMADLATWTPERVTAFMAGVAQVLNAQKGGTP